MANITIRNIPDSVFEKLKTLSEIERRSLNNEILVALEQGVKNLESHHSITSLPMTSEMQTTIWSSLAGKWQDSKSKEKQIKEIYSGRTLGRDISL